MDFGLGFCKQFQGEFLLVGFRFVEKCCGKLVLAGVLLGGLVVEKYFGGVWVMVGVFKAVWVCTTHTLIRADAYRIWL